MKKLSGAGQLKRWMAREKLNQTQACRRLEMPESMFSRIVRGLSNPGLKVASKIERLTGIPMNAWIDDSVERSA